MDLLKNIHELSKTEKIKMMEFLWEELTLDDKEYLSPKWHKDELKETEKRMADGKEKMIDWSEAKRLLRTEFK